LDIRRAIGMTREKTITKDDIKTKGILMSSKGKDVIDYILRRYKNICAALIYNSCYYLTPDLAAHVLHCYLTDTPVFLELFMDMANKYIRNNNIKVESYDQYRNIVLQMVKLFVHQAIKYRSRNKNTYAKAKAWIEHYLNKHPDDLELMTQSCMLI